jgi:hypothetical protein
MCDATCADKVCGDSVGWKYLTYATYVMQNGSKREFIAPIANSDRCHDLPNEAIPDFVY